MNGKSNAFELLEPVSPESLVPQYGLWPWMLAAIALLVVLVVISMVLSRKKKPLETDVTAMRKAAYEEASAALADASSGCARDAAVRSSLVLRKYLTVATGDPALYETHEEFLARHDALSRLSPEARATAAAGFTHLASLKYAPEVPEALAEDVTGESRALLETLHRGFAA